MKRDKKFVLVAVSHDGLAPAAAHYDLKNDPEVVAAAVKQDGRALQHASQRWREDQKLQVMAGKLELQFASDEIKGDNEVCTHGGE